MLVAGKYQLLRELAVGGFGVVYLARHTGLAHQSLRAVKLIKPEIFAVAGMRERFAREVHVTSLLSQHNLNIVRIYDDFGEIPNLGYYYVMEYLQGQSLRELMDGSELLSLSLCQHIFSQLCEAMQTAHKTKIVHRDLKPANLMLLQVDDDPYFLKVLDFGIAKPFQQQEKQSSSFLQLTHGVLGTPLYMSPEQWLGKDIDERSDIYAMGVILFELLTGRHPLLASSSASSGVGPKPSAREVMALHLYHSPLSLSAACPPERDLPLGLVALVRKALAKRPSERFSSVSAMHAAFLEAMGEPGLVPESLRLHRMPNSDSDAVGEEDCKALAEGAAMRSTSAYGQEAESDDKMRGGLPFIETMEAPEPSFEGPQRRLRLPTPSSSFDVINLSHGPQHQEPSGGSVIAGSRPEQREEELGEQSSPVHGPGGPYDPPSLPSWQTAATAYSPFAFFLAGAVSLSVLLVLAFGLTWLWSENKRAVEPTHRPAAVLMPKASAQGHKARVRPPKQRLRSAVPALRRPVVAQPAFVSAPALRPVVRQRSRMPARKALRRLVRRKHRPLRRKRRTSRKAKWQRMVKGCPKTPYFWTLLLLSAKQRRGSNPRLSAGKIAPHPEGFCVGVTARHTALTLGRSQDRFVPCTLQPAKLPPRAKVVLIEEGSIEPTSPRYCVSP